MMEMLVRNAEGNLTSHDRDYASKKLSRLDRFFGPASRVEIVHTEEKLTHVIQVTVFADGLTLRGEERDASVRAAIDLVADKLENRLRKAKGRLAKDQRRRGTKHLPEELLDIEPEDFEDDGLKITQRKTFMMKPMSEEEALLQMELLGHPFFLFKEDRTGVVKLLYRRTNGTYGLLSPEK